MATYITDSGGQGRNALLSGTFTPNAGLERLLLGADGQANTETILNPTKEWFLIEVFDIGSTSGLLGKHKYTETVTGLLTQIEAIRTDMVALHTTFKIVGTYYKTGNVCDVYRGDEVTAVTLEGEDTNISFIPPSNWLITSTILAPNTPTGTNLFTDADFGQVGDWVLSNSSITISGGKLNLSGVDSLSDGNQDETLEAGATYNFNITKDAFTNGLFRYTLRDDATGFLSSDYISPSDTDMTGSITNTINATRIGIQFINNAVGTFDDIVCEKG